MKTKNIRKLVLITAALLNIAPLFGVNKDNVQALQVTSRSARPVDSAPGATTDYVVRFTYPQAVSVGSIELEFCANNPIPGDACSPIAGFDATGTTLIAQSGETGFSVDGSSTDSRVILTRVGAVVSAFSSSYTLSNITNPSSAQSSYFLRISTYASSDATGPIIDDGGVALSTSDGFAIDAFVPPYLSFCVAQNITGLDCLTAAGNRINFGNLSDQSPVFDQNKLVITTNAAFGYSIAITGQTMTSGNNVISRISTPSVSLPGSSQFGLNLRDNTNPDIGTNPIGLSTGGPSADYNSADAYKFNSGDIVASSTLPDATSYTASYITNVSTDQAPGIYTTTLSYTAFANF